jgi:hypothetical protein
MELPKQELSDEYKEYINAKKEYHSRIIKHIKKKNSKKGEEQQRRRRTKVKCVNCNRNVGMIFKEDGVSFEAKCGDQERPCNFHIKATLPRYTHIMNRLKEIQRELNDILGELKNIKVRILYTREVEKEDPGAFNSLKSRAIELLKENRDLRRSIPQFPTKLDEIGVQPEDFFERVKYYEDHQKELQDYYIFERPKISQDKGGNFEFPSEDDNMSTLISNLEFLVKEN